MDKSKVIHLNMNSANITLSSKYRLIQDCCFIAEPYIYEVVNDKTGEIFTMYDAMILLKNKNNGIALPYPELCTYLQKWQGCKTSTALDRANKLVVFLNWLLDNEIYSIYEISIEVCNDFLESYSAGRAESTVNSMDNSLATFCRWLAKNNLSKHIRLDEFEFDEEKQRLKSPFYYPRATKSVLNKQHDMPMEIIILFLNFVKKLSPRIALGVYFQFFGGLRMSEVVNLRYESIGEYGPYGSEGVVLRIIKHNMRPDLKNHFAKDNVKRPRFQYVMPYRDILQKFYKNHMEKYNSSTEIDAVFVNNDGKPMTGSTYRECFNKCRDKFIKALENSRSAKLKGYAITLKSLDWSTHIGRGVFSNLGADIAKTALELAVMRGDKTLSAAMAYLNNCRQSTKKIAKLLDKIYQDLLGEDYKEYIGIEFDIKNYEKLEKYL